jgi:uncharacterized protein
MRSRRIADGVVLDQDVPVTMRDGVRLIANVFRPHDRRRKPVLMSVTPYGKDNTPDGLPTLLMRLTGVRFGNLDCSRWAGFEAPDPLFWVDAGYCVVQADVRGMHKSEGHAGVLSTLDAEDYYELIEWAARQPWSTGAVGLLGVSYLAMSQWRVAALRPPSLKAICPWEGVTDPLRELGFQDGVPETGFIGTWWRFRMKRGRNRRFAMAEDFPKERDLHPFDDAYWAAKRPALECIEAPALVCASWSDHGLHTRGSLIGFERIGSAQKWLTTHGGRKWETFYSPEARSLQRRFFDHFLKGEANGWEQTRRIRLTVRKSKDVHTVRDETDWPIPSVTHAPLYLDARSGTLMHQPPVEDGVSCYHPNGKGDRARASFTFRFERDSEITGAMTLTLWVSTSEGDDLDLFAVVRKFDADGHEVFFLGYNGFSKDAVAKGWLRVSHRALDPERSRPGLPWHTHRMREPLKAGEVVRADIEIIASSTFFEARSSMRLDVLGRDAARYPAFKHGQSVNAGEHAVHTGGPHRSNLLVPFVPVAQN